ncbi:MAG: CHC2 zinc finger domain-containing protein [Methylobacter sp.]
MSRAHQNSFKKLNADDIKNSIRPLDFYKFELPSAPLKKRGWDDGGICPFHADNKPGSFRVNLQSGAFLCFACDAKGSDIIAFTMTLHGLNFHDALSQLSSEWGLI